MQHFGSETLKGIVEAAANGHSAGELAFDGGNANQLVKNTAVLVDAVHDIKQVLVGTVAAQALLPEEGQQGWTHNSSFLFFRALPLFV